MPQIQANGSKEQSKRNGECNNERPAHIAQKDKQDNDNQDHALTEIMENGVGGVVHQIVAVQVRNNLYAGWKYLFIEPPHHSVDAVHGGRRIRALAHEHDSFNHIVFINHHAIFTMDRSANLPQPDFWPLIDNGNILDSYRSSPLRLDYGVLYVGNISHQTNGADIDLLRALLDKIATPVSIVVR